MQIPFRRRTDPAAAQCASCTTHELEGTVRNPVAEIPTSPSLTKDPRVGFQWINIVSLIIVVWSLDTYAEVICTTLTLTANR